MYAITNLKATNNKKLKAIMKAEESHDATSMTNLEGKDNKFNFTANEDALL